MRRDIAGYDFKRKESQQLADLSAVAHDFLKVIKLVAPLRLGPDFANGDADFQELHWNNAVVRYARPFGSPVLSWDRNGALANLDDNLREMHQRVMDERNGYIAHSVGTMEDWIPVVQVAVNADGTKEIMGVNCNHSRFVGASSDLAEGLHQVATRLIEWLDAQIEGERQTLLKLATSIGADEIQKAGMWSPNIDAAKPRSRRKPFS